MNIPTMSKQHFEYIARIICGLGIAIDTGERAQIADDFATALARCNPNFNRARFINACKGNT